MLYYNRIDVKKKNELKECDICHYWCLLNNGFKFQPNVCNECHDLVIMSMNLSDITLLNIYCHITTQVIN